MSESTSSGSSSFDAQRVIQGTHDALTVRRVFGDPIERDDVVVIPAARVRGGGGGGGGSDPNGGGEGGGAGFGISASPAGAFVIRGDEVEWRPAVDRERLILATLGFAAITVLAVRTVLHHLLRRL